MSVLAVELSFGEWLATKRKRARLSQSGLAAIVGVTRQTVSAWETGRFKPELNPGQYAQLCKALEVSAAELGEAFN